jgi:hypothetical protein
MKKICFLYLLLLFALFTRAQSLSVAYNSRPGYFRVANEHKATPIYIDPHDAKVVSIAAQAFGEDIFDITKQRPALQTTTSISDSFVIIAGTIGHAALIDSLAKTRKIHTASIKDKWETFSIQVVQQPFKNVQQALVITGSDRRGTAFGIFELSKLLGVSPLKWWADVIPEPHAALYIQAGQAIEGPPAVKYRGLFINDEDWGLQPWAAKNMDPDIKDIGPHTYAKVFELMLRLKANYIWPAMHPCTKAFWYYKDNPQVADDYAIVVGSSHCEPMLRNNVFEWAENFKQEYGKEPGEWRYDHNQQEIFKYWMDRVQEAKNQESVYTIGMRGVHDGSMPGPKPIDEKVKLLQQIIIDQRGLLHTTLDSSVSAIPQIFCPYKEVLNVYRKGLQLPDDVTIVWADDNHGYIRQLSNAQEQKRSGGSGIYYHLSYWGSPHDYLWLSSISPALISYEMTKAYEYGANRLWVFNVGDIKPAELELQFAMDLAWDVHKWSPATTTAYIHQWAENTFGKQYADAITQIKQTYYRLAAAGKPEHMGSITFRPDEENERIRSYDTIERKATQLYREMPDRLKDACFQLIWYPVKGAWAMNRKIIFAKRSVNAQNADSALYYASYAKAAFETIKDITRMYNKGKWNGIMSWHPRDLPVFNMPPVASESRIDSLKKFPADFTQPSATASPLIVAASGYTSKKEYGKTRFETIEGLGVNGKGVSLLPFKQTTGVDSSLKNVPYLEYKVKLPAGSHAITVKCLPTQSIDNDEQLFFAISVNNDNPQWVNIHAESETPAWKQNVLSGYAAWRKIYYVSGKGESVIRIYFPDEGVVVNTIEIE